MSDIVFEVENITYSYPGIGTALDNISFTIHTGESVAILGANASGKSTLLHLLNGLYFAKKGRIKAFAFVLTAEGVETPPFSVDFRSRVGFLFQNSDAQLFCSTVEEELAFGPRQLGICAEDVEKRVSDTAQLFDIAHLVTRSPQALSGGEKKKVALASIITCAPNVVLLDEPSAGLDPRTQRWLMEFLKMLRKSGMTLITCSHDLDFVAEVSDRALILSEDHKLVRDSSLKETLKNQEMLLSVNLMHPYKSSTAGNKID